MPATCDNLRRLRPLLGTFVEVAVADSDAEAMEAAVEAAFVAIDTVHRLMSFHDPESDVSRLNHGAAKSAIAVHPWTFQVLETALDLHRCSLGMFDIRIAPVLQSLGMLPYHEGDPPLANASARDQAQIELLSGQTVRFHDSRTRIDLGGIAKGFAVDRAIDVLRKSGISSGLVNAGGDLAVFGPKGMMVTIRDPNCPSKGLCQVELRNAALATSGARSEPLQRIEPTGPEVIDPATGEPVGVVLGASVRAPTCLLADALTKIVMIGGEKSAPLLRQFDASALFVSAEGEVLVSSEWQNATVLAA
ncbi:FAD:protein FMN transferase [Beijerinckiaceae bacterium]|nr:FAD:protein FMN transferase [Beijerinckiaceae bacterium]